MILAKYAGLFLKCQIVMYNSARNFTSMGIDGLGYDNCESQQVKGSVRAFGLAIR